LEESANLIKKKDYLPGKNLQLLSGISAKISWIPYFIKTEKIESVIDEYNK